VVMVLVSNCSPQVQRYLLSARCSRQYVRSCSVYFGSIGVLWREPGALALVPVVNCMTVPFRWMRT
jgi:hypothetical protein